MDAALNWYHWGLILVLTLNGVAMRTETAVKLVGTAITVIALVWLVTMLVRGLRGLVLGGDAEPSHSRYA